MPNEKDYPVENEENVDILEKKDDGRKFFDKLFYSLIGLVALYILSHVFAPNLNISSGDSFIWVAKPWRYVEILVWGLAGVMVGKLIESGWYLYQDRFKVEAIVMHLAHLIATPILVLIAVIVLSLATIDVTLANNSNLTLDLADPEIMVAVAFLLGTSPWPLWRFIQNTAERVLGQAEEE